MAAIGLIQPTRTDSGHRLSTRRPCKVRSILAWIRRGVAVEQVGVLAKSAGGHDHAGYNEVSSDSWKSVAGLRCIAHCRTSMKPSLGLLYRQMLSCYQPPEWCSSARHARFGKELLGSKHGGLSRQLPALALLTLVIQQACLRVKKRINNN